MFPVPSSARTAAGSAAAAPMSRGRRREPHARTTGKTLSLAYAQRTVILSPLPCHQVLCAAPARSQPITGPCGGVDTPWRRGRRAHPDSVSKRAPHACKPTHKLRRKSVLTLLRLETARIKSGICCCAQDNEMIEVKTSNVQHACPDAGRRHIAIHPVCSRARHRPARPPAPALWPPHSARSLPNTPAILTRHPGTSRQAAEHPANKKKVSQPSGRCSCSAAAWSTSEDSETPAARHPRQTKTTPC